MLLYLLGTEKVVRTEKSYNKLARLLQKMCMDKVLVHNKAAEVSTLQLGYVQ